MRRFVIRLAAFGAFLLLSLEVLLRTAVPASEMPLGHQRQDFGIMVLDTTAARDGLHTMGRLGRPAFRWHVNNDGFNSAWDYHGPAGRDRPCAVVVGNSYVQGLYSDVEDHLAGRLQRALGGSMAVYNLGTSGMPLSQVPNVLAFARDAYAPDLVVVLATSLDRSVRDKRKVRYSRQYRQVDGGLEAVPPTRFHADRRTRLLRESALVRYLIYNANLNLGGGGDVVRAVPDGPDDADQALYARVLDRVLDEIVAAAGGAPVVMLYDANRRAMYAEDARPARFPSSLLAEAACRARGIPYLDLTDTFWNDYRVHHRRLNFAENYHWNPYAVGLAAGATVDALRTAGLVDAAGRWSGARR